MGKRRKREWLLPRVISLGLVLFVSCLFSLFLHSPIARSSESVPVSTTTREGRLAVFDDAWARINERYYDQKFHGVDWEAQRTTFRALAAEADTTFLLSRLFQPC